MARKRRADGDAIKVKALKVTRAGVYVLRWVNPATGSFGEEATELPAVEKNRTKAARAAERKRAELQSKVDAGLPIENAAPSKLTVRNVCDRHFEWCKAHRSNDLYKQRKSLLLGLCAHTINDGLPGEGAIIGQLLARAFEARHAEQYTAAATSNDSTRRAIVIAIKAAWNWAAENGCVPKHHRPMATLKRGRATPRDLTEMELPTPAEVESILRWSCVATSKVRAGTGRWRARRPDEFFETPEAKVFGDMMHVYHSTGARTGELCEARVRDFMPRTSQLCLGKHKRTNTASNPTIRNIQLTGEALTAVKRNIEGKAPDAPLFSRPTGKWTQNDVNRQFRKVRTLAGEKKQPIRPHLTPYSFRHLYISELLMLGTPLWKVAKMAGTSAGEIERTYGHFFNQDLAAAQRQLDRRRARAKKGGKASGKTSQHDAE